MSALSAALLAAQKAMPSIQKDAINPHFRNRYVSLDSLLPPVLDALNEHGIVLSQFPTTLANGDDPRPALRTRLTHAESGDFIEDTMLLLAGKDDPQGQGSAITYARRYAVMSILGLVADEDDDGQRAGRRKSAGEPRASTNARAQDAPRTSAPSADSEAVDGSASSPAESQPLASPAKNAYVAALIKDAAKLRRKTATEVKLALVNDGYDLEHLRETQAEELIAKLERWTVALRAGTPA